MQYRPLGNTGLQVSAIGFGGLPLSVTRTRPDEAEGIRAIQRAVELGMTLIDTADAYCLDESEVGHNERLIGTALAQLPPSVRTRVVVATKVGFQRTRGGWIPCSRPEYVREQCEASLRNLRVEALDLYQHHTPDPAIPVAETVGELARLREAGKVRFIGVSNYSLAELISAQAVTEIASVQNEYSPLCRDPERDGVLEATRKHGIAFLPWSPFGGVSRAPALGQSQPALQQLARERGVSPHRVALAWLLAKGPHVLPIPGARRHSSIEDCAAAAELVLSPAELARLDADPS
jgi:aryl-alcohol dehydrogenase-like predicted oxidoreductase